MAYHSDSGAAISCAVTTSSARFAIQNANSTSFVSAYNAGDEIVHYRAGNSTVTASAYSSNVGDSIIPPGAIREIWVGDATHVALITDANTSTVHMDSVSERLR